jgi:hypothetical protein
MLHLVSAECHDIVLGMNYEGEFAAVWRNGKMFLATRNAQIAEKVTRYALTQSQYADQVRALIPGGMIGESRAGLAVIPKRRKWLPALIGLGLPCFAAVLLCSTAA